VNVSLRLEVVAQTGIALQPRLRTYAVSVQPPVTYPSLGPAELRLTNVSDLTGEAVGTIMVTGGAESSGCIWFEGANVQRLPRNADGVTTTFDPPATTPTDCIAVGAGEQQEVELRVAVDRVASGGVQGRVEARLVSDAAPAVLNAELPFAFDMHRPVDQVRRAGLFAALLLAGLLLPLVVLWLLNWWGARFEPLNRLRTATVPVHVAPDGRLSRVVDGRDQPLTFVSEDFHSTPGPSEAARQASVEGLTFSSKVPLFPFRAAHGVVASGSSHVAGSDGTMGRGNPVRGKIPFSLARQWVLILDSFETSEDADPDVRATLRVFLPEGAVRPQIPGLVDELARAVPPAAQHLAREADRRSPARPPEPSEASDEPPSPSDDEPTWPPPARGRSGAATARAGLDPSSAWRAGPSGTAAAGPPIERPRNVPPRPTGTGSPAPLDEGDSGTPSGWQPPKR
jgi:hypothetical protein